MGTWTPARSRRLISGLPYQRGVPDYLARRRGRPAQGAPGHQRPGRQGLRPRRRGWHLRVHVAPRLVATTPPPLRQRPPRGVHQCQGAPCSPPFCYLFELLLMMANPRIACAHALSDALCGGSARPRDINADCKKKLRESTVSTCLDPVTSHCGRGSRMHCILDVTFSCPGKECE